LVELKILSIIFGFAVVSVNPAPPQGQAVPALMPHQLGNPNQPVYVGKYLIRVAKDYYRSNFVVSCASKCYLIVLIFFCHAARCKNMLMLLYLYG
jgi:hypothetical protein